MTSLITDLLTQIEAPGAFATRMRAPAADLQIEVKDGGPIRFPVTARLAKKLRAVARPSPFGLREQTLHDPTVRNTWEIAASRVKIAVRTWKPALAKHLQALQADLGVRTRLGSRCIRHRAPLQGGPPSATRRQAGPADHEPARSLR